MTTHIGLLEKTLKEYQRFLSIILNRFKEDQEFPGKGGATNRGNNKTISELFKEFRQCEFSQFSDKERLALIDEMQGFLIRSLNEYYKLGQIRFDYNSSKPVRGIIGDILAKAKERNQGGPVAQHLVGAKLAIRFPNHKVSNCAYSAADKSTGRSGDFEIGNTVFHVTVSPTLGHIRRCAENIRNGQAVFLLVVDMKISTAKTLLETEHLEDVVAVESVESFVGQNISELAEFSPANFLKKLSELFAEYNRRISEVETDTSLMIESPSSITPG